MADSPSNQQSLLRQLQQMEKGEIGSLKQIAFPEREEEKRTAE